MEAMVIDRAQSRQYERALGVFGSEGGIAEKRGEVKGLTFHEEGIDFRDVGKTEVPTIGGEHDGSRVDGTRLRVEFAEEELVEAFVGVGGIKEIGWIHAVMLDEGLDAAGGSGF